VTWQLNNFGVLDPVGDIVYLCKAVWTQRLALTQDERIKTALDTS